MSCADHSVPSIARREAVASYLHFSEATAVFCVICEQVQGAGYFLITVAIVVAWEDAGKVHGAVGTCRCCNDTCHPGSTFWVTLNSASCHSHD